MNNRAKMAQLIEAAKAARKAQRQAIAREISRLEKQLSAADRLAISQDHQRAAAGHINFPFSGMEWFVFLPSGGYWAIKYKGDDIREARLACLKQLWLTRLPVGASLHKFSDPSMINHKAYARVEAAQRTAIKRMDELREAAREAEAKKTPEALHLAENAREIAEMAMRRSEEIRRKVFGEK